MEEKEFLKMFLDHDKEISNVNPDSSEYIEMDSEFMLNNPKADEKKFGNIKINTFNEWARLSLLDHDKQISYNGVKLPNMNKLVNELKIKLMKTEPEYTQKSKTKSHLKESMKAMRYLLQKNAFELLAIKDKSRELSAIKNLEPTDKMEELRKNFLPLQILKTGMQPLETDELHQEVQRCGEIIEKYFKMENPEDLQKIYDSNKNISK